ncbi:site-specific integrase [Arenibacter sp. ARW7G5Y1]|uniref:site-specific integrase n=1 Tax=Arenibacter sp. ARW7G5Y1 TaxID=2135619 RepID=UPI000D770192|nr:site-specific integrase [Arenibacter sp. ARW7G5Y1]PXX22853.1 site-specific recombinase XerD [Arenibacter sp. ARW7G5Y1]
MASIKILLRNKQTKEGLYPVILKVIKDRKIKVITLGMECDKKDWDDKNYQFKKSHPNYVQRNRILLQLKEKAYRIIDEFNLDGSDYSLHQFEINFRGKKTNHITVKEFWMEKVQDLNRAGRTGNGKAYYETMNSFFKYNRNNKLLFNQIDLKMLDKYETHLRENGCNDGGLSVRMRTLRALFNDAIKKDIVDAKYYPFNLYKISKLKGVSIKKALTREEIKKIESLDLIQNLHLSEARMLFLFSYYTRGMNFHDMMKLKWDNVLNDKIIYTRSKTKGKFIIKILQPVQEILDFYKGKNPDTDYIFPILLKEGMTPMQIEYRKSKKLKRFNSDLKMIASELKIDKNITSYVARHSYATNMKHMGISTDIISESMGHKNLTITATYLKDFDTKVIDDANQKLIEEELIPYC